MGVSKFILGNIAARSIGLKIPPYWLFNQPVVNGADTSDYDGLMHLSESELEEVIRTNALGVPMRMPLRVKPEGGDWWLFPVEPLISLTGKNIIVRRQVSKGKARGSIKERWTQDDYNISIEGVLIGYEKKDYPSEEVEKLRKLCEAAKWEVECPLFYIFGINRIVVETYEFPFTSGVQNQAYKLSAYSDDIYKLLIKRNEMNQL